MKTPVISGRDMIKILHNKGWTALRQVGSHDIVQNADKTREVSVLLNRKLRIDTLHYITHQANLTFDDF